jgi:hypothetical protein
MATKAKVKAKSKRASAQAKAPAKKRVLKAKAPRVQVVYRKKVKSDASGVKVTELVEVAKASPQINFEALPMPPMMRRVCLTGFTALGTFCEVLVPCSFEMSIQRGEKRVEVEPARTVTQPDGTKKVIAEAKYRMEPVVERRIVSKTPVWVRAIEGDERNGKGYICREHGIAAVQTEWPVGKKVRWAGGTATTLAKVCEVTDIAPVSQPQERALVVA